MTPNLRILRWPDVTAKVGFTRQYLSKLIGRGEFPEPVQLGPNSVGFYEHEINDWQANRPRGPIGKLHLRRAAPALEA